MIGTVSTQLKAIAFERDIERLTEGFTGREWIFKEIDRWLQQENQRFFILTGEPGVGKSAIAARLTQIRQDIAAYHFCIAGRSGTIEPNNVLLSLAAQLIDYFPDYAEALVNTIKPLRLSVNVEITIETIKDSQVRGVVINNLHTQNPQEALNVVLRRSLAALPNQPVKPVLLLIDSLDEAVTFKGDNNLVTLLAEANDLPQWVRFLFTTRPERRVLRYLAHMQPYTLAAESQMNRNDIRKYIENRVSNEKMQARLQSANVELQTLVNRLTELSTGNFLYIKILINDIEAGRQLLDDLSALPRSLDEIYHGFLNRFTVTEWEDRYQPILGVLAVAQEPITEVQLAHFTGIGQGKIRQNLGVLRQFLDFNNNQYGHEIFTLFHKSLRDYLLNEERNIDFWCEAKEQHQRIVNYYMADGEFRHTKPTGDRYLWHHLAYHLKGANRNSELRALLFNFDWLQAKLDATDVNALIPDFDFLSNAPDLSLVQSAIRLSAHILAQDKTQLAGQLLGRLLSQQISEIQVMLAHAQPSKAVLWLRPLVTSLSQPGGSLLKTLAGHTAGILAVTITPNGEQAVSASADCTLKIWDLNSGQVLKTLEGHNGAVLTVAIAPNGQQIISASADRTLKVWDLESGKTLQTLKSHNGAVWAVVISPNGDQIISASDDHTLKVWDLNSGTVISTLEGHSDVVRAVVITPDGQQVISASDDCTLKVWDLESGEILHTLKGHTKRVFGVALANTPNKKLVISASADQILRVWNLENGTALYSLEGHTDWVRGVAVIPNSQQIVSASDDRKLKIWDLESKIALRTLEGHTNAVRGVTIAPKKRHIVSASDDQTLKVWDIENQTSLNICESHTERVWAVAITPDQRLAISASDDRTLRVWNLQDGSSLHTLKGHTKGVRAVAVIPGTSWIVSGSDDCSLKVWDLENQTSLSTLEGHANFIRAVAVTPDGKRVVSASADRTLKIWDLESGTVIHTLEGHTDWVRAVAVTPDGKRVISASADRTLKIWDLESGTIIHTLEGHSDRVWAVTITPQGEQAISASGDCTLKVWDLQHGTATYTLEGHNSPVLAVSVALQGRLAISTSNDRTLKVWDLASRSAIANWGSDGSLLSCAVASDGVTIVTGEVSGQVHFLRLEATHLLD
jgi:WD40 repeat protein